ncbi:Ubiquitinyl hydrolase 1 [Chlorociboria aeruginascens]|nr:Ubiquitinyl hydrolase 1 [Chlorociboria aeruginascens]
MHVSRSLNPTLINPSFYTVMEQRKEDLTRRPLYVYDLPTDILRTLARKDDSGDDPDEYIASSSQTSNIDAEDANPGGSGGSKSCSFCGVTSHTVEEQKSHIRSDLHGYNLKQRLRGAKPVTEVDFEKLIENLDESLSGSDSSDSEDDTNKSSRKETTLSALLKSQAAISSRNSQDEDDFPRKRKQGSGKSPLIWFTTPALPSNTYLGIYRAIFTNAELENERVIQEIISRKQLPSMPPNKLMTNSNIPTPEAYKGPHIFLCMIGGGHFAAMVVSLTPKQTRNAPTGSITKEAIVLAHKTFHRYTTRRKQGGSQSANDSANGAAHSAGSSLRRYNEQALTDEVRALLQEWKSMIDTSELVFIRASGNTNRRTLFGPYDGQVLRQNDPRSRGFPFNTRRATQNELMRSFVELTRVKVQEVDEAATAAAKVSAEDYARKQASAKARRNQQLDPEEHQLSEEEETALLHTTQIQSLIRRSRLPALLSYLKSNDLSPDFLFYPPDSQQNHHAPTSLHLSASQSSAPLVTGLLIKGDANPTLLNNNGRTAFDLAGDRSTRDAFRVARSELGETKWDWEAAHVPAAISRGDAESRIAREKAESVKEEEQRRKQEEARLKIEGPKIIENVPLGKAAVRGRALVLGQVQKTAQEKREEESKGLTPEMRLRLDRERRARAAEERMKRS